MPLTTTGRRVKDSIVVCVLFFFINSTACPKPVFDNPKHLPNKYVVILHDHFNFGALPSSIT